MAIGPRDDLDQAWTRTLPARAAREAILCGGFDPLLRWYTRRSVRGREHLERLDRPAILVANHCSHADTPLLLRALPRRWRRTTAVAAAADYFYTDRWRAAAVSLAFCTVPIERRDGAKDGSGTSRLEQVLDDGWSLVVFAEGTRSRDGVVGPLRTGAAVLAAEHRMPIVPVHIGGTHDAMPTGRSWIARPERGGRFARHRLSVRFGAPMFVERGEDRFEVMERVRLFLASCGAQTTPDPKLEVRRAAGRRIMARRAAAAGQARVAEGRTA